MPASATSTERPKRTASSATRFSRAWRGAGPDAPRQGRVVGLLRSGMSPGRLSCLVSTPDAAPRGEVWERGAAPSCLLERDVAVFARLRVEPLVDAGI